MFTTVKGIYKAGRVELLETPPAVETAEVLVTFMQPDVPSLSWARPSNSTEAQRKNEP